MLLSDPPHGEVELLAQFFEVPTHEVAHLHVLQVVPASFIPGV
jgi:hypothetical protein